MEMDRKRHLETNIPDNVNDGISTSNKRHRLGRRDIDRENNNVFNSSSDTEEQSDNEILVVDENKQTESDSVDDVDNVVVLNTQTVEVHAVHSQNNENTNDSNYDSDIEIISTRGPPVITVETQDSGANEADSSEPSVSVELIDDWYGPEDQIPNTNNTNNANNSTTARRMTAHRIESENTTVDDDEEEEEEEEEKERVDDDDDIIILDGKPAPTTAELLSQIKQKETDSSTKTNTSPSKSENRKTFKDVTCPICMDTIENAVAAACGHIYCSECIYRALASSKVPGHGGSGPGGKRGSCPMCRKVVAYKDLVWLKVRYRKDEKNAENTNNNNNISNNNNNNNNNNES